jgi:hypothetical protein
MSEIRTEVTRRVFDGCNFLEIRRWPDEPNVLELRTAECNASSEYWGPISLTFSPEMAAELGRALLSAASEFV